MDPRRRWQKPSGPFEGGKFEVLPRALRPLAPNDLGLVEFDRRLVQGIVVGIAPVVHRGLEARIGQPLGVATTG